MSTKSILLPLDGSQASMHAADVACLLSKRLGASLVAQSVVDSQAVWGYLSPDLPGIIGSGPYMAAREQLMSGLRGIAEALMQAFEARALGKELTLECVIDEGPVGQEIAARASKHDLLVMGHHKQASGSRAWDRTQTFSLCAMVAQETTCPMLIVQEKLSEWTAARLILSPLSYSRELVATFLALSRALKLEPEIVCLGDDKQVDKTLGLLREQLAEAADVSIVLHNPNEVDGPWECATDVPKSTLLALSTYESSDTRLTCASTAISEFVQDLSTKSALILPPLAVSRPTARAAAPV